MTLLAALAASLLFALGTVLQQRVAAATPDDDAERAGFLLRLARRPQWLLGIAADGAGFVLHAAALAIGRLVVVQPVLATTVVFCLPLAAALDHRRIHARELAAAAAVTAGLACFLVVAMPSGGRADATGAAWAASFAIAGLASGGLIAAARGRTAARRGALLGAAAGVLFGLSAGLIKATVELLDDGVVAVLADWHLYALAALGYVATAVSQMALQTGALAAAVSTQAAVNPVASLLLGILAFQERIHGDAAGVVGAIAGVAIMIAGVVVLASAEQRRPQAAPARVVSDRPAPAL